MIISTTPKVAEVRITRTSGVVSGEAIIGAHAVRDLLAGISNIIGGRAGAMRQPCVRRAISRLDWTVAC